MRVRRPAGSETIFAGSTESSYTVQRLGFHVYIASLHILPQYRSIFTCITDGPSVSNMLVLIPWSLVLVLRIRLLGMPRFRVPILHQCLTRLCPDICNFRHRFTIGIRYDIVVNRDTVHQRKCRKVFGESRT